MRVAVIGLGRMGLFFTRTLASMQPAAQLAAIADIDATARARVQSALEKPLALAVDQTRAVLTAVEHFGALLQVGFMRRVDTSYARAKQIAIDQAEVLSRG